MTIWFFEVEVYSCALILERVRRVGPFCPLLGTEGAESTGQSSSFPFQRSTTLCVTTLRHHICAEHSILLRKLSHVLEVSSSFHAHSLILIPSLRLSWFTVTHRCLGLSMVRVSRQYEL
jgi:hypothetical protein